MALRLKSAVFLTLFFGVAAADISTIERLKHAESSMKTTTDSLKKATDEALMLIREFTSENASSRVNEVLEAIQVMENNALNALDELALNGSFIDALNDQWVEIQ